ncbi:MAG: leucine-rich repeat domain-containing protein [Thermoguttaceae bacterium]|nr:leucine-rich repeat domain-containing protein [Thermoguttaceae bacterium]
MNIDDLIRNTKPTPEDWFLTKTVEGGVEITGLSEKAQLNGDGALDLVLPSTIRGTKVVAVADKAFLNCEPLRSVVVPEGVETIGAYAFCYCKKLRNVVLPESVKSIGSVGFYDCVALEGFFIPANVETIGSCAFAKSSGFIEVAPNNRNYSSEEGVLFDKKKEVLLHVPIFPFSTELEQSEFTKLLESAVETGVLPTWVFTDYRIPHTVKKIDDCAFLNSRDVKRVFIHKGVEKIGDLAFAGSGIQVEVDPQSAKYSSEAGILFDKARATLLHFPGDEAVQSYAIPNTIKTIDFGAFYNCSSLEEIDIPESVERISAWAFFACSSLKEIVLPNTVKEYGDWAFAWCKELKSATIPDGVQTIGKHAFYECPSLSEPVMPKSVKRQTIVGFAFLTRHSLLPPVTPDSLSVVISEPFIDDSKRNVFDYEMPNSEGKTVKCQFEVEDVDDYHSDWLDPFWWDDYEEEEGNSKKLERLVVTDFGSEEELDEIVVPSTIGGKKVIAIGDKSFYSTDARSVVFPEGVEVVGHRVFRWCSRLEKVVVPKSARIIDEEATYDCYPTFFVHIGSYAHLWARKHCKQYEFLPRQVAPSDCPDDWFFVDEVFFASDDERERRAIITVFDEEVANRKEIVIPESIRSKRVVQIDDYAFENSSITSVVIPSCVRSIMSSAFIGSSNLTSVTMAEGVSYIGDNAFANCSSLRSVVIPKSVEHIGDGAFDKSVKLLVHQGSRGKIWARYYGFDYDVVDRKETSSQSSHDLFSFVDASHDDKNDEGVILTDFDETADCQKIVLPDCVDSKRVVAIGDYAFAKCSSIKSVVIPEGVETIGVKAFFNCDSLEKVVIPKSVKRIDKGTFAECSALVGVVLPNGLETIGDEAFLNCSSLKCVFIPASVTTIGESAFEGSDAVIEVDPENEGYSSDAGALYDKSKETLLYFPKKSLQSYVVPRTLHNLKVSLSNCDSLERVVFQEGTKRVYSNMFINCPSLKDALIPEGVEEIDQDAFYGCSAMKSVAIPKSVVKIHKWAFRKCSALFEVDSGNEVYSSRNGALFDKTQETLLRCPQSIQTYVVPNTVKRIGYMAFDDCAALTNVVIPEGVKQLDKYAFRGCASLTNVVIPSSVTTIDSSAFEDCSALTNVVFNSGLVKICNWAFLRCSSLKEVVLPETVREIERETFYKCTSLKSVVIPEGVTSLNSYLFANCSSLTHATIPKSVSEIADCVFDGCPVTLRVYQNSYAEAWARENGIKYEIID